MATLIDGPFPLTVNGVQAPPPTGLHLVSVTPGGTYTTGGKDVDLSATFSSIQDVFLWRCPTLGVFDTAAPKVAAFADRHVLLRRARTPAYTPLGTVAAPVFTGNSTATSAPVASTACIATCNLNHANLSALTHLPTGTNSAPAFTGAAQAIVDLAEQANGDSLAGLTWIFAVIGIRA